VKKSIRSVVENKLLDIGENVMGDLNLSIKKSFGEKLKLARMAVGYSRAKLAAQLGVSSKTIQSWETGRTFPENMALIPMIEKMLSFFIPDILSQTVREEVGRINPSSDEKPKVVRRAAVTDEEPIEDDESDEE